MKGKFDKAYWFPSIEINCTIAELSAFGLKSKNFTRTLPPAMNSIMKLTTGGIYLNIVMASPFDWLLTSSV